MRFMDDLPMASVFFGLFMLLASFGFVIVYNMEVEYRRQIELHYRYGQPELDNDFWSKNRTKITSDIYDWIHE